MPQQPQYNAFSERVPPQDLAAEQSVLGACLIDRDAVSRARTIIRGAVDFYAEKHQYIWEAICRASDEDGAADLITVQSHLSSPAHGTDATQLTVVGGPTYLTTLVNLVPSTANVEQYAGIVAKKARLRRLQDTMRRGVDACYEADDAIDVLVGHRRGHEGQRSVGQERPEIVEGDGEGGGARRVVGSVEQHVPAVDAHQLEAPRPGRGRIARSPGGGRRADDHPGQLRLQLR
jgi:hypothetical protein